MFVYMYVYARVYSTTQSCTWLEENTIPAC